MFYHRVLAKFVNAARKQYPTSWLQQKKEIRCKHKCITKNSANSSLMHNNIHVPQWRRNEGEGGGRVMIRKEGNAGC